jgi:EMAP domain
MKEQITYDTFDKVDIRLGTVISVKKNEKARKPSLVVEVRFWIRNWNKAIICTNNALL